MADQDLHAPTWWHAVLENREFDTPVPGIDAVRFIVVVMFVLMFVTFLETPPLLATPSAPEHP
jgi:hypothetical protein